MRTIYLLRGVPGSGKSTWIRNNNLEQYTLSPDNFRLMYQSPITTVDGTKAISQENDGRVWELLFDVLEEKMSRGEFVIVDATHYKSELLSRYKKLIKDYRYRAYVVDFTDVPKEITTAQNSQRDEYKIVPQYVVDKMHAVLEDDTEVSTKFKKLTRDEALDMLNAELIYNFDEYEKIVVFGDIHGCYEPLKSYFDKNPYNNNYFYVFLGDYIDRGVQNKEVLEFLLTIYKNDNILLLEGNHERWLRMYADELGAENDILKDEMKLLKKYLSKSAVYRLNAKKIRSSEFKTKTIPQIENIKKTDLREFCRKLAQFGYVSFGDKEYLFCHAGIPTIPNIFTASEEIIKGVGKYEDLELIYDSWNKKTKENQIMIHGHRNLFDIETKVNDKIYNLCSEVEYGKDLRILEISKEDIKIILESNPVHAEKPAVSSYVKLNTLTSNEVIKNLNANKLIKKKPLEDGIISYNFSRDAFNKRIWSDIICTARGLFIDSHNDDIVATGYKKFFNWSEVESTKSENLKKTLLFPVVGYKKENGFLGLVSYHNRMDKLFVSSKSTNDGDYAKMVQDEINKLDQEKLKEIIKKFGVTLIFEVINKDKDPHIIKYPTNKIVLLDAKVNNFNEEYLSYNVLKYISETLGVELKISEITFENWEDIYAWKKNEDVSYDCKHEGWVLEDMNGFRLKYKTRYYKFWKMMRAVKEKMQKGQQLDHRFSSFKESAIHEAKVYNIIKNIPPEKLENMSIIDIADIHYNNMSTIDI
jgi:predicted kinase